MKSSVNEAVEFNGFFYNPRLLFAPGYFAPLALANVQKYLTHEYAPRQYTVPADPRVAIGAGLSIYKQLRILPGSAIIGWRICTIDGANVSDLRFQVSDGDTQQNFTQGSSRFTNCSCLVPNGATGIPFILFAEPYKVHGGVISVGLSNRNTTTAIKCQFLLHVQEPVQSPTTAASGSVMLPYQGVQ